VTKGRGEGNNKPNSGQQTKRKEKIQSFQRVPNT